MRRRSRASSKSAKAQRRKAMPKRTNTLKVRHRSSAAGQETEVSWLGRELRESKEQLTAASEVLNVISASRGDLKPVFDTILENATRICEAKFGILFNYDGNRFQAAAHRNTPSALLEYLNQRGPFQPPPGTPLDQLLKTNNVTHRVDDSVDRVPSASARLAEAKSHLAVPMFKDKALIGAIVIYRQEVRPFTDKQVDLVKNFAGQAVIAIENTRLLKELRQRTDDLSDSLEQQTATSEVLNIISRSPAELEPVFQAILANAIRLCDAKFGTLSLYDGEAFRAAALYNVPPEYAEARLRQPWRPHPRSRVVEVVRTKQPVQINDMHMAPAYLEGDWNVRAIVDMGGARTMLLVPMLKDDALVGLIGIYHKEVRPFTDKQIALVQNFAAQAVIAIENTRLLNELRESLEQQTATADVLRVISSSPGELEPVFRAMLENAVRICEAKFGTLYLRDDDAFRVVAMHNAPPAFAEARQREPLIRPPPDSVLGRVSSSNQVVHIADVREIQSYIERNPYMVAAVELGGYRTILGVPMLKQSALIGVVHIYRQEVRPFTDKQIALVQNFAAQAVIAIENARLLNELRQRTSDLTESLEQQTATSKVLSVISGSPGDLQPVFASMLENAVRICDAKFGNIYRWQDDALHLVASHNTPRVRQGSQTFAISPWRRERCYQSLVGDQSGSPCRRCCGIAGLH
jgi:GAF domain-containing protein